MADQSKYRWPSGFFGTICELASWVAGSVCLCAAGVAVLYWHSPGDLMNGSLKHFDSQLPGTISQIQEAGRAFTAIGVAIWAAEVWFFCRLAIVLIHIRDRLDRRESPKSKSRE